jgi:hypothetical protein
MTQKSYRFNLLITALAAAVVLGVLWLGTSPRWFGFYGLASVLLATVLPIGILLWRRLETIDWRRSWALVFVVPALLLGVIQIGFWLAFFTYGGTNPTFGILREMVRGNAGPLIPLAGLLLASLWGWLFWRTANELP